MTYRLSPIFRIPLIVVAADALEHLFELAVEAKGVAGNEMALVEFLLLLDLLVFVLQIVYVDIYFLLHSQEVVDLHLHDLNIHAELVVFLHFLLVVLLQLLQSLKVVVLLLSRLSKLVLSFFQLFAQVLNGTQALLVQVHALHVDLGDFRSKFFISGFLCSQVSFVLLRNAVAEFELDLLLVQGVTI